MNPQTNGNPMGATSKKTKPHFVTVYETYQKNFDEAIENALQHPIWRDQPPESINAIDGNKVVFEMNKTFSLMAMVGIIESPYSEFFNWRVTVVIVINKTGAFHKSSMWTRKDKMRLANVGEAMMIGCGDRQAERSWGVSANTMTFMKQANEEDMKVVDIIRQQELDKLSSKESDEVKEPAAEATPKTED